MFSSTRAARPWSVIVPYGVSLGNDIHVIGEAEVTSGNFVLWSTCHVTVVPRPDHVDRFAAPCTGSPGPGRAHRATSGNARGHRARRRRGRVGRADRGGAAGVRRHRAQVAPPLVRGTGGGVAARRATLRPATGVQCGAGRECQGGGLHPTGRCRVADVSVELPGAGAARRRRGDLCVHLDGDGCAAGCPRTPSNPGSTGRGSSSPIPTSPPKPTGCSTSTTGCGTGNHWEATTM